MNGLVARVLASLAERNDGDMSTSHGAAHLHKVATEVRSTGLMM